MKSTNNASLVLSAALSSLPFTCRFLPFEFVMLRGLPLESVTKIREKSGGLISMVTTAVCFQSPLLFRKKKNFYNQTSTKFQIK